jgi:glycosyltransferase involved in cell wall biosynthesis
VNPYRGVIEVAHYVQTFNQKYQPELSLHFTVYSPSHPIIDGLIERKMVEYHNYVDYPVMMNLLANYDVGVCLWHPIKKFQRNLPIKNFEYMAVGLPVITSNFGNLSKYIQDAESGFCIDPLSYGEFEISILQLFEKKKRQELGVCGQKYSQKAASFEKEARNYLQVFHDV